MGLYAGYSFVTEKEVEHCEMIDLVLYGEDLTEDRHIKAILTVEGMYGTKEHAREEIEWLYAQGVHIVSFCWNEESLLATGVKGSPEHGLHPFGRGALQATIDCNMLVDVSYASERTFWDIMIHPSAYVIATYSSARASCGHPWNLWYDQIITIVRRGGIIGMSSTPAFVHERPKKRNIPHLVARMHYIKQLAGTEALALRLDYVDFYEGCEELHTKDLEGCSESQRLIEEILIRNFNEEEVRLIANENALRKLEKVL